MQLYLSIYSDKYHRTQKMGTLTFYLRKQPPNRKIAVFRKRLPYTYLK